ncbi:MAG: nitronate monooxygenase [Gammaproteobacteria bacterium]|nr:MAG: nitronate monooxygenase [Gammaproteobacteria bacterium]
MITTRLTRMLGIRHPVVLAGLGGVGRAELAAAVSNAGGLGMLGMIRMRPDFIRDQIRRTRALTERPFGVNLVPPCAPEPGGVGAQLQVCIEERVPVLSLFWCDAAPLMETCRAAGMRVIHQVGSVEEARVAAAAGVDVIVAQGVEAGGHVRGELGLLSLLPAVIAAVAPVPVLAAGGIVDARGLAAALSLGADGAWIGTRFVASAESEAHPDYKQRLLQAGGADTVISRTPQVEWPPGAAYRLLSNALTGGTATPSGPIARIRRGDRLVELPVSTSAPPTIHTEGQTELMANYAGQGVGQISEILPAAAIVEQMVSGATDLLRRLPALIA